MGHYPFTRLVLNRLVASGFPEADAARILDRLFLGPEADPDDLFVVARTVLKAKLDEKPAGSSHIRVRSLRTSITPAR